MQKTLAVVLASAIFAVLGWGVATLTIPGRLRQQLDEARSTLTAREASYQNVRSEAAMLRIACKKKDEDLQLVLASNFSAIGDCVAERDACRQELELRSTDPALRSGEDYAAAYTRRIREVWAVCEKPLRRNQYAELNKADRIIAIGEQIETERQAAHRFFDRFPQTSPVRDCLKQIRAFGFDFPYNPIERGQPILDQDALREASRF